MSPDAKREFEAQWCLLERRARSFLSRKRVPVCDQEDLLQEAAVRLLRMWDAIDQSRPLWPLTSTILLNLLRDRSRGMPRHEVVASLPEQQAPHDVERLGLARLELDRVRRAMGQLSTSHRSILMQELEWSESSAASPAEKMLRMRARRKLRSILEKVSGLVVLRARRMTELLDKVVALREGAATTASCVICLMLGVGGAIVTPSALTPKASARPATPSASYASPAFNKEVGSAAAGAVATLRESVAEARRAARSGDSTSTRRRSKSNTGPEDQDLLPGVPIGDGDGPGELPSTTPVVSAPSAPTAPSDPGDGPVDPPSPPSVPIPPLPSIPSAPIGTVSGEVVALL